jgi:hypothetical protein
MNTISADNHTAACVAHAIAYGPDTSCTCQALCGAECACNLAPNITDASLALFIKYAKDADNWSGTPCVGGNVGGGNLTQLKKAGMITTFVSDGATFVQFTDSGKALALTHGVSL